MKRRFNYTGRKKIPRERISIILNQDNNSIRSFNVNINLDGMNLPSDAKVYVDVYHKTEIRRFDFGTIEKIMPPHDTGMAALSYSEDLKFRILVVDESGQHGLILANAGKIKPASDIDRKPILPVEFRDIGQQIWLIEYTGDEGAPILILNRNIPNIENIARLDAQFILYVYPAVIREVLLHMVLVEGVDSPSNPSIDWHRDWLDFTKRIFFDEGFPVILNPEDNRFESEEVERWIHRVVEEFCASRVEWREYINQLSGESKNG